MHRKTCLLILLLCSMTALVGCDKETIREVSPTAPAAVCGNNACEAALGENEENCPQDCAQACTKPAVPVGQFSLTPCAAGVCLVSYANNDPVAAWLWGFGLCNPNRSTDSSGATSCPGPGNFNWQLRVCNDTSGDPPAECCNSNGGILPLLEPGKRTEAGTLIVEGQKIEFSCGQGGCEERTSPF